MINRLLPRPDRGGELAQLGMVLEVKGIVLPGLFHVLQKGVQFLHGPRGLLKKGFASASRASMMSSFLLK